MNVMENLDKYYNVLLGQAEINDKYNRWFEYLFLLIVVAALFTKGDWAYFFAIVGALFQIWLYINKKTQQNYEILAHKIQAYSMIYSVYKKDTFNFDVSHIIGNLEPKVHKLVLEMLNHPESAHYLAPEQSPDRLVLMVQENSFWNTHLFTYVYKESILKVAVYIFLAIILLFAYIASLKYMGTLDTDFLFPRIIILLLTANFMWNEIDKAILWYPASKNMLEIDNSVARQKHFSQDFSINIFSYYNLIKTTTPLFDSEIYKKQKLKINAAWAARFNQLYNDNQNTRTEN